MNEINIINNFYDREDQLIKMRYQLEIPPIAPPIFCCIDIEEEKQKREIRQKKLIEMSKKLQENEKNRIKEIKEFYKRKNKEIVQKTDRKLLEEIYNKILNI